MARRMRSAGMASSEVPGATKRGSRQARRWHRRAVRALLLGAAIAWATPSRAGKAGAGTPETLETAIAVALSRHPMLRAEEARRRAARAGVDVARSGYWPRVTASGEIGAVGGAAGLSSGGGATGASVGDDWQGRWTYGLSADQPLFDGFRTESAVAEARAGHRAQSAQVVVTVQVVALEAVAAYADVVRDREVVALREREVAALGAQVAAVRQRLERGDATATDVAQARARHAVALADLITARAGVQASGAAYEGVVGHPPGRLARPAIPEAALPSGLAVALAAAEGGNPAADVAAAREAASRHAIGRIRADGLPQVRLRASLDGERGLASDRAARDGGSVGVRVTVPLLDGGESRSRVVQARELSIGVAEEARAVRERIRTSVAQAWARVAAGRGRVRAEQKAVAESRKALAGLEAEIQVGERSLGAALDAQREVSIAEVRLAQSGRDLLVASYALLSDMGRLADVVGAGGDGERDTGASRPAGRSRDALGRWQTRTAPGRASR